MTLLLATRTCAAWCVDHRSFPDIDSGGLCRMPIGEIPADRQHGPVDRIQVWAEQLDGEQPVLRVNEWTFGAADRELLAGLIRDGRWVLGDR